MAKVFNNETDIHREASAHLRMSDEKDVKSVEWDKLHMWIKDKVKNYNKFTLSTIESDSEEDDCH